MVAHRYFAAGQPHGDVPEDMARRCHAHDTSYLLRWAIGGNEFASEVLDGRPDLPVVLMSGLVDDARQPAAAEIPLLGKPFTHTQLRDVIDRALGRRP